MHNVTMFLDVIHTRDVMQCRVCAPYCFRDGSNVSKFNIVYDNGVDERTFSAKKNWGLHRHGWRCVPVMRKTGRYRFHHISDTLFQYLRIKRCRRHDFLSLSLFLPQSMFQFPSLVTGILDNQVIADWSNVILPKPIASRESLLLIIRRIFPSI